MSRQNVINRVAARAISAEKVVQRTLVLNHHNVTVTLTTDQAAAFNLLPKGQGLKVTPGPQGTVTGAKWSKSGGYADAVLGALFTKLRAAGFTEKDSKNYMVPDGSRSSSGTDYRDSHGNEITVSDHIGVTSYENRYSVVLTFARPAPYTVESTNGALRVRPGDTLRYVGPKKGTIYSTTRGVRDIRITKGDEFKVVGFDDMGDAVLVAPAVGQGEYRLYLAGDFEKV